MNSQTIELMSRFETREGAPTKILLDDRLSALIKALGKEGSREARNLIRRLEACSLRRPCESAACPHCRHKEQLKAMVRLHQVWPEGTDLVTTSVIIKKLERAPGELHTLKLDSIKRSLLRKLEEAGCQLIPIWGYIDLSFNSHDGDQYPPHWLPHPHIILGAKYADNLEALRKLLKKKTSTSIKRPMKISPIRDWARQVSYACKPEPKQRGAFNAESSKARPSGYLLKPVQAAEAALWLADHRPQDRHFWCGELSQRVGFVNGFEP